jgi:two-component system, OmpR family, phosphate regulon response regulator PhoB
MPQSPPAHQPLATVLIADDEPSMRLLVRATIESNAYEVVEAADGDEAWTFIKHNKPKVVLLDVQMPGRTGLEILRGIRNDPTLKSIRVIVMTAKALAADKTAGMSAGADFYLTKPFSPLELLARVQEALHH